MFGTIARVTIKPGHEEEFLALEEQWMRDRGSASGQIGGYIFKLEQQPGQYMLVGIFPDRETYYANANDPKTDRWYQQMRALLAADPEWNDGEIVQSLVLQGI